MNDLLLNILISPESFGSFIFTLKFNNIKEDFLFINETIIKLFFPNEIHTAFIQEASFYFTEKRFLLGELLISFHTVDLENFSFLL